MTVNNAIGEMAREVQKELAHEVDLTIGSFSNELEIAPVLCERMDTICGLMDYQATIITHAENNLEEARFQYKRKELVAKKKYNEAFVRFKQEDRPKPKDMRRTDKEYEAIAELEASIETNEALQCEREYLRAQHALEDAKHKYETLNNHFLKYRKACDLLNKEMSKLGDQSHRFRPGGAGGGYQ